MPLTLNVGLTKKLGLPDYGSVGASCHVEIELDAPLLPNDLDGFHQHVRDAYIACPQAVNDELARHHVGGQSQTDSTQSAPPRKATEGHNQAPTNGKGNGRPRATAKQLAYARQLAGQIQGLGLRRLEIVSDSMFQKPLAELTSLDASSLIDTLKAVLEGRLQLDTVLTGVAP